MLTRARERARGIELEQRHFDLAALGMLAVGAFFAFVLYFGWSGGKVGGALALGLRFLLGGVAYVVPIALLASGAILVLRPVLPSMRPFRAGWICLLLALSLGLAGRMFGLGPLDPVRHGYFHAAYFRHHGGLVGEAEYWATRTLFQDVGAHIVFVFLLLAGVLLISGASIAGVLRVTRTGVAASARRATASIHDLATIVAGGEPESDRRGGGWHDPGGEAAPPDVEPVVRATHVEAPALHRGRRGRATARAVPALRAGRSTRVGIARGGDGRGPDTAGGAPLPGHRGGRSGLSAAELVAARAVEARRTRRWGGP